MQFGRWFMILVAFWSTCAVWAEDPLARGEYGSHRTLYWALIAIICVVALALELRDTLKKRERTNEVD